MNPRAETIQVGLLESNSITAKNVSEINNLLREFKPGSLELSSADIAEITENDSLVAARDEAGRIIGMATLISYRKPTALAGYVEDVIVGQSSRGRGAGRALVEFLVRLARKKGCRHLDLTSNKSRIAARSLYQSLGFKERETTAFQLTL